MSLRSGLDGAPGVDADSPSGRSFSGAVCSRRAEVLIGVAIGMVVQLTFEA